MAKNSQSFVTPAGRLILGSVYEPKAVERDGVPVLIKSGKNAGQVRKDYFFRVAIPKEGESHWRDTEWGAKIWAVGHDAFGGMADRPQFVWKILDGDSDEPTVTGMIPVQAEGAEGCWLLSFTGSFAPQIVTFDGSEIIKQEGVVYPGCYVQVGATVVDNASRQTPGVYLNYNAVAFTAHGERITFASTDYKSLGFGKNVKLPLGASKQPISSFVGDSFTETNTQTPAAYPNILTPPPAPAAKRMTQNANGISYEQYVSIGWTDEQLIDQGLMQA